MSKKFTYYGSKTSRQYFLDLFPSAYYYSLNRGSVLSGDVARLRQNATSLEIDVEAEEINQSTLTALFPSSGQLRARILYNQGSAGAFNMPSVVSTEGANVSDEDRLPYTFNSIPFLGFQNAPQLQRSSNLSATILDKNSTVYLVYRSQYTLSSQGVFYEQQATSSQQRVGLFSATTASGFTHSVHRPATTVTVLSYGGQQPTNTLRVVAYRKTGTTVEAFDENGLVDSATVSETFASATFFELGRQAIGGLNFTGFCGAVIVRTSADDNTTLNNIINFLKTEYGI
jgi:hypothetical protein